MKAVILTLLLLSGCTSIPNGVSMTEAEAKECRSQGCSVWTEKELTGLMRYMFGEGVKAGARSKTEKSIGHES